MEMSVPTITKNYFHFCYFIFKISFFLAHLTNVFSTLILNIHIISMFYYVISMNMVYS
jgi:hypothetical protein